MRLDLFHPLEGIVSDPTCCLLSQLWHVPSTAPISSACRRAGRCPFVFIPCASVAAQGPSCEQSRLLRAPRGFVLQATLSLEMLGASKAVLLSSATLRDIGLRSWDWFCFSIAGDSDYTQNPSEKRWFITQSCPMRTIPRKTFN